MREEYNVWVHKNTVQDLDKPDCTISIGTTEISSEMYRAVLAVDVPDPKIEITKNDVIRRLTAMKYDKQYIEEITEGLFKNKDTI